MPPKKTSAAAVGPKKPPAAKKAAPATKASTTTKTAKKPAAATRTATKKRKAEENVDEMDLDEPKATTESDKENDDAPKVNGKRTSSEAADDESAPPAKKQKVAAATKAPAPKKTATPNKKPPTPKKVVTPKPVAPKLIAKIGKKINSAPPGVLDIFVFGEGSAGELGLGSTRLDGKKPIDVKRPRLNSKLSNVVQISCGGMHAIALTKDNKILTWGVNDQGALGRDTSWDGGLRDADQAEDDSEDEDEDDTGLNPKESNPAEIDLAGVQPGTVFTQVIASDSASFALTEDGRVYGWGTFRAGDGILGFSPDIHIQDKAMILPEPTKVVKLASGSNHILALDHKGKLHAWGCPEQSQLGRRCVQRGVDKSALRPGGIAFKRGIRIQKIACGNYHSFAIDQKGQVYAWGLNNFCEVGVEEGAGDAGATVQAPTLVESLSKQKIVDVCGGEHHSLACTEDGDLLVWGRIDGNQIGLTKETFNEKNAIYDEYNNPRILKKPTAIPNIPAIVQVDAGTDNSFAITKEGTVFSWGFSANYQTGLGVIDDVLLPTLVDNSAVHGRRVVFAGAGGQFSVLACEPTS